MADRPLYAGVACSIEGCTRQAHARTWCVPHYQRWLDRGGDPAVTLSPARWTHRLSRHPLYQTWHGIIRRCTWPSNPAYPGYGGRGIAVHEPWLTDVAAFITWIEANLGERPEGHSLDRIDNDGHYEPGNLRWATRSQQAMNQRPRRRADA